MFPRKTEEFWEGTGQDLPLSWEIRKTTKRAFDCLNESLEASEVNGSFPMPPTFT